jgi:hypothetical protein
MANGRKDDLHGRNLRYQLYGWLLFIACALLFLAESIVGRAPLIFAGSVIFLVACILFLIPLLDSFKEDEDDD